MANFYHHKKLFSLIIMLFFLATNELCFSKQPAPSSPPTAEIYSDSESSDNDSSSKPKNKKERKKIERFPSQQEKASDPLAKSGSSDEQIAAEFKKLALHDQQLEELIKHIEAGDFEEAKKALQDKYFLDGLDQKSVESILTAAGEIEPEGSTPWGDLLMSIEIISLLDGPNGPLVEALHKFDEKVITPNLKEVMRAISDALPQVIAKYQQLSPEARFSALAEAVDSRYGSIIVPSLLKCQTIISALISAPKHAHYLLFKAAAQQKRDILNAFLDEQKADSCFGPGKMLGAEEAFFFSVFAFSMNEGDEDFTQEEQLSVLPELFKNQIFKQKLLAILSNKQYKSVCEKLQKTALYAIKIGISGDQEKSMTTFINCLMDASIFDFIEHETFAAMVNLLQTKRDQKTLDLLWEKNAEWQRTQSSKQHPSTKPRGNQCKTTCVVL